MKENYKGYTLLEILLVLVIGAGIIVFGFRQYTFLRLDADVLQLQENIDTLFVAAADYYRANCGMDGQLDPVHSTVDVVKIIDISADLINGGYLASTFPTPNPLVNPASGFQGYFVQFVSSMTPRYQQVCSNPPDCTVTTDTQIGTIVNWQIWVGVSLNSVSSDALIKYKNYLAADCFASIAGLGLLVCQSDPVGTSMVAFNRTPTAAMSSIQSNAGALHFLQKQYLQMETTNPITELTSKDHSAEYQYFYCND